MFKKVSAIVFTVFALLSSQLVLADDQNSFATLFQRAMSQGKSGNGFAAGYACTTSTGTTSCASPYGGSLTQNYAQWSPTGGTTSWSYNNFTISVQNASMVITMVVNGSFTFTGTVASNGILDGRMTGNLVYDITIPTMYGISAPSQHLTIGIDATFSNGNANIKMTSNGQTITMVWSQTQLIGYLY